MSHGLEAMQDPKAVGLGSVPAIEPSIASFIVSPDEALRESVHCPNVECHHTDELLSYTYNSMAFLGGVCTLLAYVCGVALFTHHAIIRPITGGSP